MNSVRTIITVLLSSAVFIAACFMPAVQVDFPVTPSGMGTLNDLPGFNLLQVGYVVALQGKSLGWLANPAWLASIAALLLRKRDLAFGASLISILLAMDTVRLYAQPDIVLSTQGCAGPLSVHFAKLMPGFFIWLTSMCMVALSSSCDSELSGRPAPY